MHPGQRTARACLPRLPPHHACTLTDACSETLCTAPLCAPARMRYASTRCAAPCSWIPSACPPGWRWHACTRVRPTRVVLPPFLQPLSPRRRPHSTQDCACADALPRLTLCPLGCAQSTARAGRRRRRCSTRGATSRRPPPSGRRWRTWLPSAPAVRAGRQQAGACCWLLGCKRVVVCGLQSASHAGCPRCCAAAGAAERADYQEHAWGLGAGPAGLLGFAESGIRAVRLAERRGPPGWGGPMRLRAVYGVAAPPVASWPASCAQPSSPRARLQGRALEGPVYAAASKAALMQPLDPAARNVQGLAAGAGLAPAASGSRAAACVELVHAACAALSGSPSCSASPVQRRAATWRRRRRLTGWRCGCCWGAATPPAPRSSPPASRAAAPRCRRRCS